MPLARQYDMVEKTKIMMLYKQGISVTEIAYQLGRSTRNVRRVAKALKDLPVDASPPPAKKRSGRPRKTDNRQDERLRRHVLRFPFKSAKQVKNEVPGFQNVTVRHIQRILQKRLGLPSRKAAAKPLLTAAMAKKRLAFAKKYLHLTKEQWEKVMFSDESTFRTIDMSEVRVRRPASSNRYEKRYTSITVKHPDSVMVWACFSGLGRGALHFMDQGTTMNSDRYMAVLEDKLFTFMKLHKATMFLQDSAPCHKSKKTMALLDSKSDEFVTLDWPGNSPDLNPIENLWAILKKKLREATITTEKKKKIDSVKELKAAIRNIWTMDISRELCMKLCHSMPERLKMVVACNGQMTKY